jgi:dihydroflavonol-4-reductase
MTDKADSSKTVCLTGATGFVGRHVAQLLAKRGHRVRCLVRKKSKLDSLKDLGGRFDFVTGDVLEPRTLVGFCKGADWVIHCAGYRDFWHPSRDFYFELNLHGAENVMRAALASKVKKVVHVSTPLAFGMPSHIPFNERTPAGPHHSDYARSKYLGDCAAWRLYEEEGLPLTIVYLAAVIGAGDPRPTMEVQRFAEGRIPVLVGANTTFTYVHIRDAALAIVRAAENSKSVGERYLIGGERATTREYFQIISDLTGVPLPRFNIPESVLLPFAELLTAVSRLTGQRPLVPADIIRTSAAGSLLFDGSKAERELGIRYTPLRTALAEAVAELPRLPGKKSGN